MTVEATYRYVCGLGCRVKLSHMITVVGEDDDMRFFVDQERFALMQYAHMVGTHGARAA